MQCPNCEFNNMPGATDCGRCGSTLRANALTIDVHPPRAAANVKFWRRFFPARLAYRFRDEARLLRRDAGRSVRRSGFNAPPPGVLGRMIVPGWALLHVSNGECGWLYLAGCSALWVLSLVMFGSVLGNLALGLAFGLHAGSCLSVLRRGGNTTTGARLGMMAMIAAGLLVALYLPAGYLVSRVATPLRLDETGAPFANGDVLIMNPNAYSLSRPQPGDIVLHRRPLRQMRNFPGGIPYMIVEGEGVDRVLAGPGDKARWDRGQLWVNERESPLQPLNPNRCPGPMSWSVPEEHYLILPSTSVALDGRVPANILEQIAIVAASDISGKVYFRTQPLSRWGRIR